MKLCPANDRCMASETELITAVHNKVKMSVNTFNLHLLSLGGLREKQESCLFPFEFLPFSFYILQELARFLVRIKNIQCQWNCYEQLILSRHTWISY